jgi:trehalose 6-phosphate phosphatase
MNPFDQIDSLAQAPILLVGCDYDGTLAPIVGDPHRAFPRQETMVALKALAAMQNTHVALISGRALQDLAAMTGSPDAVHLVGSHGSEFDPGFADTLSPEASRLLERVRSELQSLANHTQGVRIERKPASVAFHYRNVGDGKEDELVEAVLQGPASHPGVYLKRAKKVIELSVVATDKGSALQMIRRRVGASVALYLGDDQTDEDAFITLSGPDISIKVGEGRTRARFRLEDTDSVSRFLARLAERRAAWLAGSRAVPIETHSFLSDQRAVALVTSDARVVWFCSPRIDSPALFAELIGGPTAGYFSVSSADGSPPESQDYREDSMEVRTRWPTFRVIDYLDCSEGRPHQRAGRTELIRVIEGRGRVAIEFAPRIDLGRTETRLRPRGEGLEIEGSPEPMVLRAPGVEWTVRPEGQHEIARAEVDLEDDEPLVLELRCGTGNLEASLVPETQRRTQNRRYWGEWVGSLRLPPLETDLVRRSALVLKALCHGPTGAFAAAASSSLPEHLGGVRNWDYRYGWIRDSAMAAEALVRLGSLGEAMHYLDWVLGVMEKSPAPEQLRPVYTVTGHELGIEAEIAELPGYAGSRPVRVGNAASVQLQLDVFGPLAQLVVLLQERGAPLSPSHWKLVQGIVTAVEKRWHEPDHGIWEIRGPRRHFVHSKVMCWQAVDRAITLARRYLGREMEEWRGLRDRIAADVLERGWKPKLGAFAAAYDGTDLDAASLQVGLSGLLPPDDERFLRTLEAVERYLREGPTVYRYRYDDGLPGSEGGFHLCTSWLVDAYLLTGRRADAEELFGQLVSLAGPTGLFSEEYDPRTRTALGNHPQAYSHLALIRNAVNLSRGRKSGEGSPDGG